MKLALGLGPQDARFNVPIELIQKAEALGFDSVWTAETYGADAMTPLAFIAAHTRKIRLGTGIAQLDARTPANLAMCAQTIDALAGGGRMIVGIGVSGPQIVEGWYGRPWGKPNPRLRDTVAILKKIFRRESPVSHEGKEISLPYQGEGAIGLGKPLKGILHSGDIPVYLGTDTPLNVRMTGEVADGWLGFHLVPSMVKPYRALLEEGLARRSDGRRIEDFDIQGAVGVKVNPDVKAALQEPKPHIALYAGGMGAKDKNFHKEAMVKRGYGEAAERIQELFLAGRKEEAAAAVPDDYVDEEWLVGPPERIRERFKLWRDSGITTLTIRRSPAEVLELIADAAFA
ncbi:5,10-methylenetetrahydromethanopterin reductase [Phenylobacterium zucineum HLK1]|uniref:5,10-methylenetetrahydromethanopterin reductase n=1 Tax=Phenylobacterium zucineum (strain HLK1) TaxID=450851 RepID=B4RH06_PHEZH|nr:LLM class F420-dependent oxidoreductase [Phenylobacterium zucineum]ACG78954.1 5,10-methylenetetrahydromethanopterin reductase [Phenylobacterium zucineum HLK1]